MPGDRTARISEHSVQLFDSSKSMAESVASFLLAGFRRGEPLLVVATPEHRERLRKNSKRPASTSTRRRWRRVSSCLTPPKRSRSSCGRTCPIESRSTKSSARSSRSWRIRAGCASTARWSTCWPLAANYKAAYQLEVLWNALAERESVHAVLRICVRALRRSEDRGDARRDLRDAQPRAPQEGRPAGRIPARAPRCRQASRFDRLLIHATIHACR